MHEVIFEVQAALFSDVAGIAHDYDVIDAVPPPLHEPGQYGLRCASRIDHQPACRQQRTMKRREEGSYAGAIEITEAVAKAKGSAKLAIRQLHISHVARP